AFTITPIDNMDPNITTCPGDQNVSADENCMFTMMDYTSLVVADDNCTSGLTITQSPEAGELVSGTTTVTITVTDEANNASTCNFQVIVFDDSDPVIITCAPDTTVQLCAASTAQMPDFTGLVIATDNCDNNLVITQ